MTLNSCKDRNWLRPGLNFILRVGWDIFPFRGAVGPRLSAPSPTWTTETGPRGFLRRHHLLHTTHHDATPRIEQIILASLRAYRAGAAEMELMESRRHRGARAGVFGEAARGREIVQVRASIPPTSSPLPAWAACAWSRSRR